MLTTHVRLVKRGPNPHHWQQICHLKPGDNF